MLLHAIGRMEPPGATNTWLQKYIFPGGYTPALSEVLAAIEKVGLWVTDIEVLRLHYAETLRHWRQRFLANREPIKRMAGYDDRFCRMWEFYLAGCEIAFRYMNQMVFQIQLARRQDAVPLTRDYIVDAENGIGVQRSMAAERRPPAVIPSTCEKSDARRFSCRLRAVHRLAQDDGSAGAPYAALIAAKASKASSTRLTWWSIAAWAPAASPDRIARTTASCS